jgi:hypothetical protein
LQAVSEGHGENLARIRGTRQRPLAAAQTISKTRRGGGRKSGVT